YAPSAAAVEMAESILKDKKKVLPCAAYLEGEYGIQGLFVGVPVKLGALGIEQIYEIKLTDAEHAMLNKTAAAVQELLGVLKSRQSARRAPLGAVPCPARPRPAGRRSPTSVRSAPAPACSGSGP